MNRERRIAVNLAQSYIAAAFDNDVNYKKFLKRGIKHIRFLDRSFSETSSWDEARVKVARLRMEV